MGQEGKSLSLTKRCHRSSAVFMSLLVEKRNLVLDAKATTLISL